MRLLFRHSPKILMCLCAGDGLEPLQGATLLTQEVINPPTCVFKQQKKNPLQKDWQVSLEKTKETDLANLRLAESLLKRVLTFVIDIFF